jgi:hypothetical protein
VLAECVDRGEDGAQAVGVVGEERGGLVDRLLVEGNPTLTSARAVGGSVGGSAGEAEAAANLGERDVVRLPASFSGEPVLSGGGVLGVLGVFERLCGRGALQGAQAKELGEGDDDGGLAPEVDDLVGSGHGRVGGGPLPSPVPRLDPSRAP